MGYTKTKKKVEWRKRKTRKRKRKERKQNGSETHLWPEQQQPRSRSQSLFFSVTCVTSLRKTKAEFRTTPASFPSVCQHTHTKPRSRSCLVENVHACLFSSFFSFAPLRSSSPPGSCHLLRVSACSTSSLAEESEPTMACRRGHHLSAMHAARMLSPPPGGERVPQQC